MKDMPFWGYGWLDVAIYTALFGLAFAAFYYALLSVSRRRARWPSLVWKRWLRRQRVPKVWLRLLAIRTDSPGVEYKRQLLARCGVRFDAIGYETGRRLGMVGAGATVGLIVFGKRFGFSERLDAAGLPPVYVLLIGSIVFLLLVADRVLLESMGKYRAQQIMKEIYTLSHQLLYYNGSKMNLHHKLTRCLPFTKMIRQELQLLLNEWYAGAESALKRFKERLGTEEAYSFGETINSIRLFENNDYYSLLRERLHDYKEKLELAKDSRKETTSYALFVIAGLPILNTFRIFIYPWVMEGQKLFQTLQ
nr:hypothetical protein [Paenibacillus koleovorans]